MWTGPTAAHCESGEGIQRDVIYAKRLECKQQPTLASSDAQQLQGTQEGLLSPGYGCAAQYIHQKEAIRDSLSLIGLELALMNIAGSTDVVEQY